MKNTPATYVDIVEAIDELLSCGEGDASTEFIESQLRAAGFDPVAVGLRAGEAAERAFRTAAANPLDRAARERAEASRRLQQSRLSRAPAVGRDELTTRIREIVARSPQVTGSARVQAHFRNLERATEQDLADLLAELEFLSGESGGDD